MNYVVEIIERKTQLNSHAKQLFSFIFLFFSVFGMLTLELTYVLKYLTFNVFNVPRHLNV